MRGADGNISKDTQAPSTSQPQAGPDSPPVQFTFINQHSDIQSVRDRRIQNRDHRHEIRSHVMRGVRLGEHNKGVKRPTGRTATRNKSRDPKRSTATSSVSSLDARSDDSVSVKREGFAELKPADSQVLVRTTRSPMNSYPTPPLYTPPDNNLYGDPFNQTPITNLGQQATDTLLHYCFNTFMPMTFPVEDKRNGGALRHDLVIRAKMSNHATFSGFLATIACHRAVMYKKLKGLGPGVRFNSDNINDSYFTTAHQDAIEATRVMSTQSKMKSGEADPAFIEACFGLISTTTIVGEFTQARTHIEGVQRFLRVKGATVPETAAAWLPLADIKAALGMLEKPRLPIPWPRMTVSGETIDRILPPVNSPLRQMASSFGHIPGLSSPLKYTLIRDAWIICFMCDFNARDVNGLTLQEHEVFRLKSLELEYDLLEYVDRYFAAEGEEGEGCGGVYQIPPTEDVIRLAMLGLLSTISVHILPGTGLGRATTRHQMNATRRWFESGGTATGDLPTLKAVTWALFVFALCSKDQDEAAVFREMLVEMTARLALVNWDLIEATMCGFLFVPNVIGIHWKHIWEEVQRDGRRARATTPTRVDGPPGRGRVIESASWEN